MNLMNQNMAVNIVKIHPFYCKNEKEYSIFLDPMDTDLESLLQ